nr:MAG TPA: hypothetical protein [Caudoviricetes sp.]
MLTARLLFERFAKSRTRKESGIFCFKEQKMSKRFAQKDPFAQTVSFFVQKGLRNSFDFE